MNPGKLFFITLLIFSIALTSGCSIFKKSEKTKKPDKELVQYHKHLEKQYEDARETHMKTQSDRTKEMMKETKKRSRKLNRKHKDSWLKRLLGIKQN
jgi:hypothetical protein